MTHHHARMLNEYGWHMGKEKLHAPSQHAILTCIFFTLETKISLPSLFFVDTAPALQQARKRRRTNKNFD